VPSTIKCEGFSAWRLAFKVPQFVPHHTAAKNWEANRNHNTASNLLQDIEILKRRALAPGGTAFQAPQHREFVFNEALDGCGIDTDRLLRAFTIARVPSWSQGDGEIESRIRIYVRPHDVERDKSNSAGGENAVDFVYVLERLLFLQMREDGNGDEHVLGPVGNRPIDAVFIRFRSAWILVKRILILCQIKLAILQMTVGSFALLDGLGLRVNAPIFAALFGKKLADGGKFAHAAAKIKYFEVIPVRVTTDQGGKKTLLLHPVGVAVKTRAGEYPLGSILNPMMKFLPTGKVFEF